MSEVQRRPPNIDPPDHRPAARAAALARGARPGWTRLMPQRRRAAPDRLQLHARLHAPPRCAPRAARPSSPGKYPSRHGVTLTMTHGDLFPDQDNVPDVLRTVARLAVSGEVPRSRLAEPVRQGHARLGPKSGNEPELEAGTATLATLLRERGYHVAFKGKWHLSKPVNGTDWSDADSERIERDYGFAEWEPPDAGGDAKAATFGGGNAGTTHEGWDEDYTRQMERWLGAPGPARAVLPGGLARQPARRARLPVVVRDRAGTRAADFRDLGVPLPATVDEDLRDKPTVHSLMKLGQTAYIGALERPGGPAGLRELLRLPAPGGGREDRAAARRARRPRRPGLAALAHGDRADLRPRRARDVPRRAAPEDVQRLRGVDPRAVRGLEPGAVPGAARERRARVARGPRAHAARPHRQPRRTPGASTATTSARCCAASATPLRDAVLFTYDDHQAGTAFQDVSGQPNRIRCVRDARWKYAVYLDPTGDDAGRVRAVRPRERSRRGAQPRGQAHRPRAHARRGGASASGCTSGSARRARDTRHDLAGAAASLT